MAPTYDEYRKWDEERRARFPTAAHWIYQSRLGDFKVATWCALTGRCTLEGSNAAA